MFFKVKCLGEKLRKRQGKILINQGNIRKFDGIKKWEPLFDTATKTHSKEKIVKCWIRFYDSPHILWIIQ